MKNGQPPPPPPSHPPPIKHIEKGEENNNKITKNATATFINNNNKPLALYIFSKNKKNINRIINETSSGGVCINHSTLHYSNYHLPFGGVNNSGSGRCHGVHGFKEFSNAKSIFKQLVKISPTDLIIPPYTRFKEKIINLMIKYF